MSDPITLSIIVPVYNIEAFLPESLDSLAKIKFDDPYEIIVIDDGSSDGSLAILRAWEETHKQLRVITGPNGGVSRARNAGLDAAKGKYITFVDGDDTVEPGFFQIAVKEMEENGWDLVQGNARFIKDNKLFRVQPGSDGGPDGRLETDKPEDLMEWFFGNRELLMLCVWGKVYRRELLEDVRFIPDIRIAEDQKFVFDVLKKTPKTLILDVDACNYAVRETSALNSSYDEKGWDAMKILALCEKEVTDSVILRHIQKRKTDVLTRIYNTAHLKNTDTKKALDEIRKIDLKQIRPDLSKKEYSKLKLLQRTPDLYNALLRITGTRST